MQKGWLRGYKEKLLDIIYPRICFGCKRHIPSEVEGYICLDCLQKIEIHRPPFCITCGRSIDLLEIDRCTDCAGCRYYFTRGYSLSPYDGLLKECLHSFKYNWHTYLGRTLARLMTDFALKYIDLQKIDVITAVPLHWRRQRDRGFNQSVILGRIIADNTGIPFIEDCLIRIRTVQPQVELSRQERIRNVEGVFAVRKPKRFLGKRILLIDDVFTTGATLNECSRVLLKSGAGDVWVFTLSRGISS